MTSEDTGKKALLLELGEIYIPRDVDMPCFASRSTAGPDSGLGTHAFRFGEARVKLSVTKDPDARLRLARNGSGYSIYLDSRRFIEDVRVLPVTAHAPNQAFVNLSPECRMGCAFCSMPEPGSGGFLSAERAMRITEISAKSREFEAVAVTSGIPSTASEANAAMAEFVRAVRSKYPKIPIGVEAYFDCPDEIAAFREAGATEMKINIETWPGERFRKICPGRDFQSTLEALEKAVEVFGRGKVTSNVIVGLGETDREALEAVRKLADLGIIANIRGLRVGPGNREKLERALGFVPGRVAAERLLALGERHREILEMNGLDTRKFETMCFSCRCCDIVPMADI